MTERLTDKNTISVYHNSNSEIYLGKGEEATKYIYKLAQLEDIMEKHDIESVEELDYLLEVFKKMRKEYGKLNQENYKNRKDRDTWKKACELACETLKQVMGKPLWIGGNIPTPEVKDSEYFYQQAKTEVNNDK